MKLSIKAQLLLGIAFAVVFYVGRQAYQGQYEWLSGPDDAEIRAVIAETTSPKGFVTLEETFPEDAAWLRDEIKRHIKLERRHITSNISARNLMVNIRRRHADLSLAAPDDLNRAVILYQSNWIEAVSEDAEMCQRVMSIGDAGVLIGQLDLFADDDLKDNSAVWTALRAGQAGDARAPLAEAKMTEFVVSLVEGGYPNADFAILQSGATPEVCQAMTRYLRAVAASETPLAERARATIAKSLLAL